MAIIINHIISDAQVDKDGGWTGWRSCDLTCVWSELSEPEYRSRSQRVTGVVRQTQFRDIAVYSNTSAVTLGCAANCFLDW